MCSTSSLFIHLKIIKKGQETIIENLESKAEILTIIFSNIENLFSDGKVDNYKKEVLFILAQSWLFNGNDSHISVMEIAEMLNCGRKKIESIMKTFEEQNYIKLIKKRPKVYTLTSGFADELKTKNQK